MTASAAEPLRLLQISDLHLLSSPGDRLLGVDTWDSAGAVLRQALGQHTPDAILVTGDVAHHPEEAVYRRFARWLGERFHGPALVLPGNHDVLGRMGPVAGSRVLELGAWTVVGLDSHADEVPEAHVGEEDMAALRRACTGARGKYVLVATHHPPVEVGSPWLDKDRIQEADELLEWMSGHGRVRAMVFGHAHQEVSSSRGHITLLGTPSTCFQFAPRSRRFAVDGQKPGYRWIELGGDGTVASRVCRVDDYPLTIDHSRFQPA